VREVGVYGLVRAAVGDIIRDHASGRAWRIVPHSPATMTDEPRAAAVVDLSVRVVRVE
jgi:hypothetical protein